MSYSNQQLVDMTLDTIATVVAEGQAYSIQGARSVTRADLPELRENLAFFERRVALEAGQSSRTLSDFSGGVQ